MGRRYCGVALALAIAALWTAPAAAQAPLRKIGELDLQIRGVSASCEPPAPVIPRHIASAVRIVVRSGATELSSADVGQLFGDGFIVEGELSGPGLTATVTLPHLDPGEPPPADPLLLPIPALPAAGDYTLSNLRVVSRGRPVLDVAPASVLVKVIDQVLVTSVKTRPLTLDELRDRGVDLSSPDNYLGFAFTLGLKLESSVVSFMMPVVFDRQGRVVPEPIQPPPAPPRSGTTMAAAMPTFVPMLLEAEPDVPGGPLPSLQLPQGTGAVRIPGVLVIPGNVGYLKQFFSAQLFVANGAPGGSGLVVRDVTGRIVLPLGSDGIRGTDPTSGANDDPLSLPDLVSDGESGPQREEQPVRGLGVDGVAGTADDTDVFRPAEQGLAEFTVRGDREGFHTVEFDIRARLEGLPVGAVRLKGHASGGVLVRNPYFSMTFTAPSVVRSEERFSLFATVTNVGQSAANVLTLRLDDAALSGLELAPGETGTRSVESLAPGAAESFEFAFTSRRTGQVVASYLRFDTDPGSGVQGDLRFTVGVGERGVPLSPDTLMLPASVDGLPADVVHAAMRVLGQAWSVANAPSGTLPSSVVRTTRTVVTQKALALAEAGLRVRLGQDPADAVRDLLYDFWAGEPAPDPGFDQLLRTTEAGRGLATVIGSALAAAAGRAGGVVDYERELAALLASGRDALTFAVAGGRADVSLRESGRSVVFAGGRTAVADLPGAVITALAADPTPSVLGLLTAPGAPAYQLDVYPLAAGSFDLSVTIPRGDGSVLRGTLRATPLAAGEHARVVLDLLRSRPFSLERDVDRDGAVDSSLPFDIDWSTAAEGPRFVAARVVGPETLSSAGPFGTSVALLFDRVVDAGSAAGVSRYAVPQNAVESARRQLSGRIVFATLARPEGNYLPARISVDGVSDLRGHVGLPVSDEPIVSLVEDPGAVVTGRVVNGDGSPLTGAVRVTYSNYGTIVCGYAAVPAAVSQMAVDDRGAFELRYVRRSPCGEPFTLVTQDPVTGAARQVTRYVRSAGERIVADIVLLARGSVTGTVRRFRGAGSSETEPAPGVTVVVLSSSDPQSGGSAVTDGDGRYRVDGVTVGPVVVRAGGSSGVGSGGGRIDRPGTPAVVDLLLDERAAAIHGTVFSVDPNVADPAQRTTVVPGVQVLYWLAGQLLAVATTDQGGAYRIAEIPVGDFTVSAALNQRDTGSTSGRASVGQDVAADVFINVPKLETLGTLRGGVTDASGRPAPDVYVAVGDQAVATSADGSYEITGVPTSGTRTVLARTRDGKRFAMRAFDFPPQPSPVAVVDLQLSGLGEVRIVVKDAAGRQLHGQQVLLQGICTNPCGCRGATTGTVDDDQGAIFGELPIGTHAFRAFAQAAGYTDVAGTSATLTRDGQVALAVIQFRGAGRVSGVVFDPPQVGGRPANGADVVLSSRVFLNDGERVCDLVPAASHRVRTGLDGTFAFTGVTVGSFTATAHSDFLEKDASARGNVTRAGESVGPLTLQLVDTMAGVLSGRVYLPDGTTPAGAGIEVTANGALPDVTVKTGADGVYRFAPILAQGNWTLTALDRGTGLTVRTQIALRQGEAALHDLRLKGRGAVRVHVVDGADRPVTEALVRLDEVEYPARRFEAVLSPSGDGTVAFDNVTEGGFVVTASDPLARGGRSGATLPAAGETVDVTVRMTTTGTVSGHFRLPGTSAPVALGTVTLAAHGRTVGQVTTDGSADPGFFSFSYVPAGEIRVEALDPLTGRTGFNVGTLQIEGQQLVLDVTAQALGTVTGAVTLNGVAEPRARVDLVSNAFRVSTFAGADGVFRLEGVPEGRVVVTAARSGGGLSGTAAAALTTEGQLLTMDVALRDTGRVEGTVRAAGGGTAPLAIVTVQVGGTGGATLSTTTRPDDGYYAFEQVPAGTAAISVEVPGSIDRGRAVSEVPPRASVRVDLELVGTGSIVGTVSGVPVGYTPEVRAVGSGAFPYQVMAKPDASGHFYIPEVLAGPVTVFLRASGNLGLSGGSAAGVVLPRQTAAFDLALQPTGRVVGSVWRADGRPAFGAEIRATTSVGQILTQAGVDGHFALDVVPAGPVSVAASDKLTGGVGSATGVVPDGAELVLGPIQLDDTPVIVTAVDPPDGTASIALDRALRVTFSDEVSAAYQSTLFVTDGVRVVSPSPLKSADALTWTIPAPYGGWPDGRELTLTATVGISDVFGRHPASNFTSRFRTVDVSAPRVAERVPADGAIQVPPDALVSVTFDEPLSSALDPSGVVALSRSAAPVTAAVSLSADRRQLTLTPAGPLAANERYTVVVAGAQDESGNRQSQPVSWTFVTTDTIAPLLTATAPVAGAWTSSARPAIHLQLADVQPGSGIDPLAADGSLALDGTAVPFAISASAISATPSADLADGSHVLTAAVRDRAGNRGDLTPVTFGVDRTPPAPAALTRPSAGETQRGLVAVSATSSDAASGVASIRVYLDGAASPLLTLVGPEYAGSWSTASVAEGRHSLAASALDRAGNAGPLGTLVYVLVDNQPLTIAMLAPAVGARMRDQVTVRARTSEAVSRVDFAIGSRLTSGSLVADRTYEATLDLAGLPEGDQAIVVTAVGLLGESVSASVGVVVDRTPPAAPVAKLITAEESDAGYALVQGLPGAVERQATVEVTHSGTGLRTTSVAALDGSFATRLIAALGAVLEVVASDSVGYRSAATRVTVQRRVAEGGVPLQGLAVWVSADEGVTTDGTGHVQGWADRTQSATPNNLTQAAVAARPAFVADGFNGWPVLRFDGSDDALLFTRRVANTGSVFWAVKESGTAGTAWRSLLGDASTAPFTGGPGSAATATTPEIPGSLWHPTSYAAADVVNGQTWLNGVLADGTKTPRPRQMSVISWVAARAGAALPADRFGTAVYTAPWNGDLAELIVYDRPLTPGERQSVEDYLARKYRPYVPAAGTPAISPAGGAFTGSTTVQLTTSTPAAEIRYTLDGSEPAAGSELYVGALLLDRSATVKARAFAPGYLDSATATASFVRRDESPVLASSGLALWLRSDAGLATNAGGWVTSWGDQSGTGNDAYQANGSAAPALVPNTANGLPVLRFDGNDTVLFTRRLTTVGTVLWVVKESSSAGTVWRSLLGDASTAPFTGGNGTAATQTTPEVAGSIWHPTSYVSSDVANGRLQLDGLPVDGRKTPRPREMAVVSWTSARDQAPVSADRFGEAIYTSPWQGDLAELIVYDRVLPAAEVKQIEDYLRAKYAIGGVPVPAIEPAGGLFDVSQSVRITTPVSGAEIRYTLDGTEPTTSSSLYADPLELVSTTAVKAKAFTLGGESATATASFTKRAEAVPLLVDETHLQLWWRADAGVPSGTGGYWADQSGKANHGYQPSGAKAPVLAHNAVNGLPAMRFDGEADTVLFTRRLTTVGTVLWVVKESSSAGTVWRSLLGDASTAPFTGGNGTAATQTTPEVAGSIWHPTSYVSSDVANGRLQLDGLPVDGRKTPRPREMAVVSWTSARDQAPVSADRFGEAIYTSPWQGDLAELIVYDRVLPAAEVKQIEDYLRAKYAIGGVPVPAIEPAGGLFDVSQSVRITTPVSGAEIRYTLDGTEPTTSSSLYADPLELVSTTAVKAKAFTLGGESATATASFTKRAEAVPLLVDETHLQLWWRADAGVPSGTGGYWADQSGKANHGYQPSGAKAPVLAHNAVNGLPAMRFDGEADTVLFTRRLTTVGTVLWVVKESSSAGTVWRSLLGDASTAPFTGGNGTAATQTAPEVAGSIWHPTSYVSSDVANGRLQLDGLPVDGRKTPRPREMAVVSWTSARDQAPLYADRFGEAVYTSPWKGDLAELIVYDRVLSAAEVKQIEDYLNARYRLFVR